MKFRRTEILNNYAWSIKEEPFVYATTRNVFTLEFYRSLCAAYIQYVSSIKDNLDKFGMSNRGYDNVFTHIFRIDYDSPKQLRVFLSIEWHSMLSSIFDIPFTKDINVAVHYHDKGDKNGWIHNDLNPGWFVDTGNNEINIADSRKCDYKTGRLLVKDVKSKKVIRSLAMIYYLNNPATNIMVGGGTGLYRNAYQPVEEASLIVPPENNSILVFPCTPYSYHAFLANKSHQRCSIIMWLHSQPQYIKMKYGEDKIVNWI